MKKIIIAIEIVLMTSMVFAAQCLATTKKGTQCKRQAAQGSQYCWQHGGKTKGQQSTAMGSTTAAPVDASAALGGQCKAVTKSGTPCSRKAKPGSVFCWQHADSAVTGGGAVVPMTQGKRAHPDSDVRPEMVGSGMCQGKTQSGAPCSRKARPGSKFCWQHMR